MKHISLFLLLLLPLGLSSQIILSQIHVPAVGDTLFYARDSTTKNINIGSAGPARVWDFTSLKAETSFQLIATEAASDPNAANYPGANLVVTTEQVKTFIQSTDTAVYILGGGIPEAAAFGLEVVRFKPPQKLYQFPATYGTSFVSTYGVDATVDGRLFLPLVDSIRVIRQARVSVEIDAYGTVKTPFNSYEALRQRTETFNTDSLYALYLGSWLPLTTDTSRDLQYQWLAAETKGNAVTVYLDPATGTINSIEYFVDIDNANAPLASFTYEDQGQGAFAFSDQSGNTPTAWQWTFGDGGSSTEQNPSYTYTVAGDYQVCLTAGNLIGSDQFCQTLTVALLSTAPDPAYRINTVVYPNPADQWIRISRESAGNSALLFSLYNHQGQKVAERRLQGSLELPLGDLPAGLYHYFIQEAEGKPWSSGKLQISHR